MRLTAYRLKCDNCGVKSPEIYEDAELEKFWFHKEEKEYFPNSRDTFYMNTKDFCSPWCVKEYNERS